jgi:hypothetical protein
MLVRNHLAAAGHGRMTVRSFACLVLVCAAAAGCGQTVEETSFPQGTALWSRRLGHGSGQETVDLAVDPDGNTIVAGRYYGETDFGAGPVTSPADNYQVFLAKYAPDGAHLWSKAYGDFAGDGATAVGTDASGNVYVAGFFGNKIDFGGGEMTSSGSADLFLAKLDASGTHVWSLSFGDADNQRDVTLAVDSQGNCTLFGTFYGQVDFGGGLLDGSKFPLFVARFDSSGNHLYSRIVDGGSSYGLNGAAVAADAAGNAYLTGQYSGVLDFGSGPLTAEMYGGDIFVAKLGPDGAADWVKSFGADTEATWDEGTGIAVDPDGNVLVTGAVAGNVDFGGGVQPAHPAGDGFDTDPFILKLDAGGGFVWARRFGGTSSDHGRAIAADLEGNVVVTGDFYEAMVVAGKQITGAGMQDAFLLKLDAGGNPVWGRSFGNENRQTGMSVAVDADGAALVGGAGYGPIDLGDGLIAASGYFEVFVGKFAP